MNVPVLLLILAMAGCCHALVCFICNNEDDCDNDRSDLWFKVCEERNMTAEEKTLCVSVFDEDREWRFPTSRSFRRGSHGFGRSERLRRYPERRGEESENFLAVNPTGLLG
ncbi:unnamed protein product [Darwinula stevensoni]|uniref:Uncharacterized protein n=1 Tax=Darwinula stevensoni TaxID=69355 RepID=A0A7R9FSI2_9CRUS|nr:unnamed protein product [Darwinula stevensoni]CAG0903806.1 unnamed protein product [Darwinula stevensoni]